jgi:Ca-activated chloride channel family protein
LDQVGQLGQYQIRAAIKGAGTGGMTDLSSGYLRGLQEARKDVGDGGATIIVLSDGHTNSGIVDPQKFREMAAGASRQLVTTSSIGIGTDYDDLILSQLAIRGTVNHFFAVDGDAAAAAVAAELAGLLSKTVQAASLLIKPTDEVSAISVLNDLPAQAVDGAVLVELGDFYCGEQRRLLFKIDVPAMAALGLAQVA